MAFGNRCQPVGQSDLLLRVRLQQVDAFVGEQGKEVAFDLLILSHEAEVASLDPAGQLGGQTLEGVQIEFLVGDAGQDNRVESPIDVPGRVRGR